MILKYLLTSTIPRGDPGTPEIKTILLLELKLQCLYDLDLNQDYNGVKSLLKLHTVLFSCPITRFFFHFCLVVA
jgi:hypothetical protein